jgi:hypothetical protein
MATTTNYGWTTPDDTALVKDGAAAIRTLGTSIDTTTKNLNPSTTLGDIEYRSSTANTNTRLGIGSSGQVLTVAAGVPSWAAVSPLSAKGDLYTRSSTVDARLPIGTNGYILTADSAETTGIKWAAAASGGGMTLLSTTSLSGASTTATIDATGYQNVQIILDDWQLTGDGTVSMRVNGANADPNYGGSGTYMRVYDYNTGLTATSGDALYFTQYSYRSGNQNNTGVLDIPNANNTATWRVMNYLLTGASTTNAAYAITHNGAVSIANSSVLGSFTFLTTSTFSGGTIKVWGIK